MLSKFLFDLLYEAYFYCNGNKNTDINSYYELFGEYFVLIKWFLNGVIIALHQQGCAMHRALSTILSLASPLPPRLLCKLTFDFINKNKCGNFKNSVKKTSDLKTFANEIIFCD